MDRRPLSINGRAEIIAVSNFKGGVGKTTTSTNIAVVLAQRGHKVLLIDCDAQASASKYLLGEEGHLAAVDSAKTLTEAVRKVNSGSKPDAVLSSMISTGHGVDIVAASLRLARVEFRESGAEHLLKEMLVPLRSVYDWIILDSPPNPGLPLSWALTAATGMIVPVRTEPMDSSGLELILEEIELIQRRLNPTLRVLGVLPNQYDSRKTVDQLLLKNLFQMDPVRMEFSGTGTGLRVYDPVADQSAFGRAAMMEIP
ncbi:ParA family protein, partial [Azospirillum sp. B4]|uniref:ParA family protein n=1 Tax=Azospirillum sp. B4 TaxID=95605 RepID=UPI0020790D75